MSDKNKYNEIDSKSESVNNSAVQNSALQSDTVETEDELLHADKIKSQAAKSVPVRRKCKVRKVHKDEISQPANIIPNSKKTYEPKPEQITDEIQKQATNTLSFPEKPKEIETEQESENSTLFYESFEQETETEDELLHTDELKSLSESNLSDQKETDDSSFRQAFKLMLKSILPDSDETEKPQEFETEQETIQTALTTSQSRHRSSNPENFDCPDISEISDDDTDEDVWAIIDRENAKHQQEEKRRRIEKAHNQNQSYQQYQPQYQQNQPYQQYPPQYQQSQPYQQYPPPYQQNQPYQPYPPQYQQNQPYFSQGLFCQRCGQNHMIIQTSTKKEISPLSVILIIILVPLALYLFIFSFLLGIFLLVVSLILAATGYQNVTVTYAVCQDCGYRQRVA